jgi:predicted TIM-barrel fold metal-dependent hydrolase
VFGSDAPYDDQQIELLKITKADVPKEFKEGILSGNILKIL